jgi:hypothetical protein
MKNGRARLIAWSCLLALPLFSAAAFAASSSSATSSSIDGPRKQAEALEENAGYGYLLKDGTPSLEINTAAVFAPDDAVLVVDRNNEQAVKDSFKAQDLGNGTWSIPDPETGATVIAKVQYARSVYTNNPATASPVRPGLPVVSRLAVSILPLHWPRAFRLRFGHRCGVPGYCLPGSCANGFVSFAIGQHLLCEYTGAWGDICIDYLKPVCQLVQYNCLDCTGSIVNQWPNYRYVCATF